MKYHHQNDLRVTAVSSGQSRHQARITRNPLGNFAEKGNEEGRSKKPQNAFHESKMRGDTGTRTRDERRFSLPPIRDLQDQRVREWDNGCKFFISERRKCQWRQQAIDSGDDRGATAVLVAGRTRGDDSTAPGRRCQTT